MLSSGVLVLASLLVILTTTAYGQYQARSQDDYPNPKKSPGQCVRDTSKISYVCDPDSILEDKEVGQLNGMISRIMNETRCPCSSYECIHQPQYTNGYKVGIALMRKMSYSSRVESRDEHDDSESDQEQKRQKMMVTIDQAKLFAHDLHKSWKLGRCEEDVLILYSQDDNVIYTVTGSVVREKLDDNLVGEIALDARRRDFQGQQGAFSGLLRILEKYHAVLMGAYIRSPNTGASIGRNDATSAFSLPSLVTYMLSSVLSLLLFYTN